MWWQTTLAGFSRHLAAGIAGGLFVLCAAGPSLAAPTRFSNGPAAKWELVEREGDRHCQLRTRVPNLSLGLLDVDRTLGARKYEWRFHGPRTGKPLSTIMAGYVIGPGPVKHQQVVEADDANGRRSVELEFEGDEAALISTGAQVAIAIRKGEVITIDTEGMTALVAELDACSRNYLVEVGADPKMVAETATTPAVDDEHFAGIAQRAAEALRRDEQGTAGALVVVGKSGEVQDCRIIQSSGVRALDVATCDSLRRSKFTPGLNAAGEPIDAPTTFHVHWVRP